MGYSRLFTVPGSPFPTQFEVQKFAIAKDHIILNLKSKEIDPIQFSEFAVSLEGQFSVLSCLLTRPFTLDTMTGYSIEILPTPKMSVSKGMMPK